MLDTFGLRRIPGTILPIGDDLYVAGMSWASIDNLRPVPDNVYILAHAPASYDLSGFRVLTIIRDPRNCLVSYCRHRYRDGLLYSIPQALKDFWGTSFIEAYRGFLGWRGRAVIMRYEDMPQSVIGNGAGIYARHDRDWNTRTGRPSRWQDVWDDTCQRAWVEYGGPELLTEAGYA